jgi:hypothetical protein
MLTKLYDLESSHELSRYVYGSGRDGLTGVVN